MNAVPAALIPWLLSPITGGTVKAVLVDTDYTFSSAHDFLNDVTSGARVQTVTVTTSSSGNDLSVSGPVVFSAVANGQDIEGVWFYLDAGSDATRRLLYWVDTRSSNLTILFTPNGLDVTVDWPDDVLLSIGG